MTRNEHQFRLAFCGQRWRWTLACLVLAAAWFSGIPSAQASVMLPQMPEFKLDDAQETGSTSGGNSSAPVEQQRQDDQSRLLSANNAIPSGSSSSTSTSGTGTGGSSPTALDCLGAVQHSDLDLAGWVSGQVRLFLPMPPGNELLRPPQAV